MGERRATFDLRKYFVQHVQHQILQPETVFCQFCNFLEKIANFKLNPLQSLKQAQYSHTFYAYIHYFQTLASHATNCHREKLPKTAEKFVHFSTAHEQGKRSSQRYKLEYEASRQKGCINPSTFTRQNMSVYELNGIKNIIKW